MGICGIDNFVNINGNSISLSVQFNYGLKKIVNLIMTVEKNIEKNKNINPCGSFRTEEFARSSIMKIYAFNGNIFMVYSDVDYGFLEWLDVYITDLRGNTFERSITLDEESKSEEEEVKNCIIKFIKSQKY